MPAAHCFIAPRIRVSAKIFVHPNFSRAPLVEMGQNIKTQHSLSRVCLLTETYYPLTGGGESQTRVLAASLLNRNFQVLIITRRCSDSWKEIDLVDGVSVYRIPPVGTGRFTRWFMLFWSLLALAKTRRQYDVVYVSGFKSLGLSAVLAAKLFRKACILKADSNGEMSGEFFAAGLKKFGLTPSSRIVRILLSGRNKILRSADYFVAITVGVAEELKAQSVSPSSIVSITNSVDTSKFRPVSASEKRRLRQQLVIPRKTTIVTYAGRLVSYKGLPLLLRVAEMIQSKFSEVGFVLVGSGGVDMHNCEAELKKFVKEMGLEESICFSGEVGNVHEYLQASDIFVLPSEEDAFPLALVEAMACGLPVISTPVGGIQEIITDRQNGLLVQARDFQQLFQAISELIRDPTLSASLGTAAVQTVQERYSAEIIIEKYCELFRRVHSECLAGSR
jgi:glycosyltransferase involved in cell wall biosynthesis